VIALLAVGLNIVVGWAGLLDLGYVAFFGFGAYGFALLSSSQIGPNGIHLPTYLSICGQDPMLAAEAIAVIGGMNCLGSLAAGWLGARYPKHILLGGLYILRGESTEITTYDEDGYIMGERISVRRPKNLYFDEISLTNASLSPDPTRIGVSHRFRDFDQPNYRQFLVDKKFGKRARASTDFTTDRGVRTWRQGISLKTPELRYVDTIIFEDYERVHPSTAYGFALSLDKAVTRRLSFNGGYASIDSRFGGLNSDRFNIGKRVFLTTTYVVSPRVTASYYITTAVGGNPTLPLRTMSNLVVGYNVLPDLRRTGLF